MYVCMYGMHAVVDHISSLLAHTRVSRRRVTAIDQTVAGLVEAQRRYHVVVFADGRPKRRFSVVHRAARVAVVAGGDERIE